MTIKRFTVHKNTRDQRKARTMRNYIRKTVNNMIKDMPNPDGFAVVIWDRNYDAVVDWRTESMPAAVAPEFVKVTMLKAQTTDQINTALHGPVGDDE